MLSSDWLIKKLLRSDWLLPIVALLTTQYHEPSENDDNTVDIDAVYTTLTPSGTIKRDLDDYTDIFKGDERIDGFHSDVIKL